MSSYFALIISKWESGDIGGALEDFLQYGEAISPDEIRKLLNLLPSNLDEVWTEGSQNIREKIIALIEDKGDSELAKLLKRHISD